MFALHLISVAGGLGFSLFIGMVVPTVPELAWIAGTAVATTAMQWALVVTYAGAMVDTLPFSFLSVVFNMILGTLAGDPWPTSREMIVVVLITTAVALNVKAATERSKQA